MRRIAHALVAMLMTLLGIAVAHAPAAVASSQLTHESTYDSYTADPRLGDAATERGPPAQRASATTYGANSDTAVGGIINRGSDGLLSWNEQSGHFWQNWTPQIRQQFVDTMRSYGVKIGG